MNGFVNRQSFKLGVGGLRGQLAAEQRSKQHTSQWSGGEQVPYECHGEVLQHSTHPEGRKLIDGGATQNYIKQNGGHETHRRTHD